MPFAAAQIGLGFRNEIAPRNGLLRVREFCMAEIEHFVNPDDKTHPKFKNIAHKAVVLFPADAQLGSGRTTTISIGEAVNTKIINNETLGYFMARTQIWLEKIGVDPKRMRFRQHLRYLNDIFFSVHIFLFIYFYLKELKWRIMQLIVGIWK